MQIKHGDLQQLLEQFMIARLKFRDAMGLLTYTEGLKAEDIRHLRRDVLLLLEKYSPHAAPIAVMDIPVFDEYMPTLAERFGEAREQGDSDPGR